MAAPDKAALLTMDYAHDGGPLVRIASSDAIAPGLLDIGHDGAPLWVIVGGGTVLEPPAPRRRSILPLLSGVGLTAETRATMAGFPRLTQSGESRIIEDGVFDFPPAVVFTEDFETGSVLTGAWVRDNTWSTSGAWSLKSPVTRRNQSSEATLTLVVERPGFFTFDWLVSAQEADAMSFLLGGVQKLLQEGSGQGAFSIGLDKGTYTMVWRYSKNYVLSYGFDCAWIDNLKFTQL